MNSEILQLWPIPVYKSTINVDDEWLQLAKKEQYKRMDVGNGYMTTDYYILKKIPKLKLSIENCIEDFTKNFLKINNQSKFYILNSWINKHQFEDFAQKHYHGNSLISGVYYLNVEKNSGDIEFVKNHLHTNTFSSNILFHYTEDNFINTETVRIIPKEGLLLLFPSHLEHKVTKNMTKQFRYSLAFNVFVRGKYVSDEVMDLEIK